MGGLAASRSGASASFLGGAMDFSCVPSPGLGDRFPRWQKFHALRQSQTDALHWYPAGCPGRNKIERELERDFECVRSGYAGERRIETGLHEFGPWRLVGWLRPQDFVRKFHVSPGENGANSFSECLADSFQRLLQVGGIRNQVPPSGKFLGVGCVRLVKTQLAVAKPECRRFRGRPAGGLRDRNRHCSVVPEFQQVRITRDDKLRLQGDSFQQRAADEFCKEPRIEGIAEQNFLSAIGAHGCGALEFQRASVLIRDQQTADVTATVDFDGFHEAQPELFVVCLR